MDEFLQAALNEAEKGLQEGGIPIGSVLVIDGRVVGRGHNRRVQKGSAILHALYFWTLSKAYEGGDLSLVYPIARGSMPLFVTLLAVLLIHEKLSVLGVSGITLVVFLLSLIGLYVVWLRYQVHDAEQV